MTTLHESLAMSILASAISSLPPEDRSDTHLSSRLARATLVPLIVEALRKVSGTVLDEIATQELTSALRWTEAENTRLREQLSTDHQDKRITELILECTRHETEARAALKRERDLQAAILSIHIPTEQAVNFRDEGFILGLEAAIESLEKPWRDTGTSPPHGSPIAEAILKIQAMIEDHQ